MIEKCECGGDFIYSKEEVMPYGFKSFTRSVNANYFSGLYLRCEKCKKQPPSSKVVKKIEIPEENKIFTKSQFGEKIGAKPPSVHSMIENGRAMVVVIAGKEFVYYDGD